MNIILDNQLLAAVVWVLGVVLAFMMASVWMVYLMKIVSNDEEIQEKIRRHKRISEEIMRADQSGRRNAA